MGGPVKGTPTLHKAVGGRGSAFRLGKRLGKTGTIALPENEPYSVPSPPPPHVMPLRALKDLELPEAKKISVKSIKPKTVEVKSTTEQVPMLSPPKAPGMQG